jgi:hypothetical protein
MIKSFDQKITEFCGNHICFSPKIFNLVYFGQNLSDSLAPFLIILQIKQRMCDLFYHTKRIKGFMGDFVPKKYQFWSCIPVFF